MPNHVHGIVILDSGPAGPVGVGLKPAPTDPVDLVGDRFETRPYATARPSRNRKGVQDIFR